VGVQPRSTRASLDVQLKRAANFPAEGRVLLHLKVVQRAGDAFLSAAPSPLAVSGANEFRSRVRLPQLKGRDLSGFKIEVRDEEDNPLGEGSFPK
jgi:hypothetical protein